MNNAGVATPGMLSQPAGMEDYLGIFDINLHSPVALSKLAVPHLLKVKGELMDLSQGAKLFGKAESIISLVFE